MTGVFQELRRLELVGGSAGHVWCEVAGPRAETIVEAAHHEATLANSAVLGETHNHAEPEEDGEQKDAGYPHRLEHTEHQ